MFQKCSVSTLASWKN